MSWQDEIDIPLREWFSALGGDRGGQRWQRVGAARRGDGPGRYVVDIRATDLTADQPDDLRLAGSDERSIETGFPIMDAVIDGEVIRLRVAEFAAPGEPHLWRFRRETGFLVKILRERFGALGDAGLADQLARGEVGGTLAAIDPPVGWGQSPQGDAYRACRGEGLWLVWGPPGTGKTRVLRAAVGDLMAAGKRVLLVSGTNIAVDNAVVGVTRERRHRPGDIVRVGAPALAEIANDPNVCLPLMERARLADVEEQRRAAAEELLEMNRRQERLRDLEIRLDGFDPARYDAAAALLATHGHSVVHADGAVARCQSQADDAVRAIEAAGRQLKAAAMSAAEADPMRPQWAEIERAETELAEVEQAAQKAERRAFMASARRDDTEGEVAALRRPDGGARWRDRRAMREARKRLDEETEKSKSLRVSAFEASRIAAAFRTDTEGQISRLSASSPLSRNEIRRRDTVARWAAAQVRELEQEQASTLDRLRSLRDEQTVAYEAEVLITACDERGWPELNAQATVLRRDVFHDGSRRHRLEERHAALLEQYERLAKGARGEIIKAARVVATTLAQFRLVKDVFNGPYDVVLIDEVGFATLPEVLLAVAKAGKCAVLFGDFMQLGPILPPALQDSDEPIIRRWLVTDAFRHVGINTPADAVNHPGCLVLDTQHRFGPDIMRLANLVAYGGQLKPGPNVRAHVVSDPEIVLVDTDGLHELAEVQRTSRRAGWWAAGLLLSRALVELHHENSESVGVVTPYVAQAKATLEALRDVELNGQLLAEVATAHSFQGREFPIVVFDTVEPQLGESLWIGQASLMPGSNHWRRTGGRLFNVASTRAQHRLYVIASRERVVRSEPGTTLGHFGALLRDGHVRGLPATSLVTPPAWRPTNLGPDGTRLAELLARHVTITDVNDERSFYDQFDVLISQAQHSIWIWSAWVASRVRSLLPLLKAAVDRGVRVTVFVRDPSDPLQQKEHFAAALASLRDVVPNVVEVKGTHEKIVVIDDHTVMLGSLNVLSQQRSREVMITMSGHHWARRLLNDLHAEQFSKPPRCGACNGRQVCLGRAKDGSWYWRCYNTACPDNGKGRYRAWTHPITLRSAT